MAPTYHADSEVQKETSEQNQRPVLFFGKRWRDPSFDWVPECWVDSVLIVRFDSRPSI